MRCFWFCGSSVARKKRYTLFAAKVRPLSEKGMELDVTRKGGNRGRIDFLMFSLKGCLAILAIQKEIRNH